ncbi:hypothetical protein PoB_006644700 [Plakobranchus ocellatus]|uniref:Uncharacterized protein n=1 Tax=Plakobranchus ocellatus TaxID=259542 RepID=A0AAV4D732_9GAST|nr:hypothetical protein PoB_006644700 [Plakobranchus ocellatus]
MPLTSSTSRNLVKLVIICLVLCLVTLLSPIERVAKIAYLSWPTEQLPRSKCKSVLATMTVGRWVDWKHRSHNKQREQLEYFLHSARQQHFLPYDLQRSDKSCGNVTFEGWSGKMNNLLWFRALCDPDGDTPCCYDNRCEARREDECRCADCFDLRQRIHAELASWIPSDPTCEVHYFTGKEDTCHLLKNMTIYIMGDSFLRHVYISLLALLRSNTYHGPLYKYSPKGMIHACDRNFVFLRMCISWIDRETKECVVLGIGIHDDFNFTAISTKEEEEAEAEAEEEEEEEEEKDKETETEREKEKEKEKEKKKEKKKKEGEEEGSRWPEVIWASTHAPGLLKSPRIPSQSKDSIARYNAKTKAMLSTKSVPVFDTFELTKQTMSFDGAHFGRGVNDMKAQILLNYILEQRENSGRAKK